MHLPKIWGAKSIICGRVSPSLFLHKHTISLFNINTHMHAVSIQNVLIKFQVVPSFGPLEFHRSANVLLISLRTSWEECTSQKY